MEIWQHLKDIDFSSVTNRNEERVRKAMLLLFAEAKRPGLTDEHMRQIYALALNLLPSRYRLRGTIILNDPVRDEQINEVVQQAFLRVYTHPKG